MPDVDDALLEAFAKILRKQRTAAGLSQEELAHRAGVSMRYVSLLRATDTNLAGPYSWPVPRFGAFHGRVDRRGRG